MKLFTVLLSGLMLQAGTPTKNAVPSPALTDCSGGGCFATEIKMVTMPPDDITISTTEPKDGRKVYTVSASADWACVPTINGYGQTGEPNMVTLTCIKADKPDTK